MTTQQAIKEQMKQQIAKVEQAPVERPMTLRERLESPAQQVEFAKALGKAMSPVRFVRMLQTAIASNPQLQEADWKSVVACGMVAAQLGLEPNTPLSHAWILPFRDNRSGGTIKAQFILGYRGIVELAHRSEKILSIQARVVRRGDEFDWSYGTDAHLHHVPVLGNRADPLCFYAVANFNNGGHYFVVVSPEEIEEHRRQSKSPDRGPWVTHFLPMAMKTCVRMAAPYLPLTSSAAAAIEADETTPDYDTMVGNANAIDVNGTEQEVAPAGIDVPEEDELLEPSEVCEVCGAPDGLHESECPERPFDD